MLKYVQPWVKPAVAAFLIIMSVMVLSFVASTIWGADDVREWIGAYSGWVFGTGAVYFAAQQAKLMRATALQTHHIRHIEKIERQLEGLERFKNRLKKVETRMSQHRDFNVESNRAILTELRNARDDCPPHQELLDELDCFLGDYEDAFWNDLENQVFCGRSMREEFPTIAERCIEHVHDARMLLENQMRSEETKISALY